MSAVCRSTEQRLFRARTVACAGPMHRHDTDGAGPAAPGRADPFKEAQR